MPSLQKTNTNITVHLGVDTDIDWQHPTVNVPQGWLRLGVAPASVFGVTVFPSSDRPTAIVQLRALAHAAGALAATLAEHERIDALPDDPDPVG